MGWLEEQWENARRTVSNPGQIARDVMNPIGAGIRQATGNQTLANALTFPAAITANAVTGNGVSLNGNERNNAEAALREQAATAALPAGQLTPDQSRQARNDDFDTGRRRWDAITQANPEYLANIQRYKDMSQGLNAQEMTAAREQMAGGMNSANSNAMRKLYSAQARSGVRGGMAGAQAARVARQGIQDRQAGEQKLLLDNYALKSKGLDNYSNAVRGNMAGSLATGTGEAQMGVGERTASMQQAMTQAMLQAQQNQPRGFFSQLASDLF